MELVGVHRTGTQRTHAAIAYQAVQRLHGLLHRRGVVEAVDDVEVEVVRTQALQGAGDLALDRLGGQVPVIEVDLRGEHHVLAGHAQVLQRLADKAL